MSNCNVLTTIIPNLELLQVVIYAQGTCHPSGIRHSFTSHLLIRQAEQGDAPFHTCDLVVKYLLSNQSPSKMAKKLYVEHSYEFYLSASKDSTQRASGHIAEMVNRSGILIEVVRLLKGSMTLDNSGCIVI